MKELGIIINQNGEYVNFGEWVPRETKDKSNPKHWHDEGFLHDIYNMEWYQELNIPYDETKRFTSQLEVFAKCGIIIINNIKEEEKTGDSQALQMVLPAVITSEQITTMNDLKEKLTFWAGDCFSIIDIIDEDGNILDDFYNINDYYEYLEEQKTKLHR